MLVAVNTGAQSIGPGAAVPAVANLPGIAGTFWQSDVTVYNPNEGQVPIRLLLLPEIRGGEQAFEPITSDQMTLPALGQVTFSNVVLSVFGLVNEKGALALISEDGSPVVVGSRTYTFGLDGGTFGQDVSGIIVADQAWAAGAQHDSSYRTNVGLYLPPPGPPEGQTVDFTVTVRDPDGEVAGSGIVRFANTGMQQHSLTAFGVEQLVSGSIEVTCSDPSYFWYGYFSRVDQISGDAVYRPLRGLPLTKDLELPSKRR
jgi:hypothetical protein